MLKISGDDDSMVDSLLDYIGQSDSSSLLFVILLVIK
jgi:hypothetical protein